ncbi:hypothetical protein NEPTK9_000618 [Candidatus Neptunochlamydia vexilliferae]|uniref:Transposase n=1 Tax=Candidatus Neptunichlamydia vexilliferae TaxID=1651774 RepID=A0ABS0AYB3_9BACT|nr:hypothetical protein [Candidatus Neptunochlamydia vexilliferae]
MCAGKLARTVLRRAIVGNNYRLSDHGKQNLSAIIAMLILFSFLVHVILRLVGQDGIVLVFQNYHARRKCIELLRNMTEFLRVTTWEELYASAMKALEKS